MTSPILKLSNELLLEILAHIEADPERLVSLDRRAYLSQESFRLPATISYDHAQTVGSFRLTCQRFRELGSIYQFARVTTRFSRRGFRKLEWLSRRPHLARHVKKFSYLVPYFYVDTHEHVRQSLLNLKRSLSSLDVRHFVGKMIEQEELVKSKDDARILEAALRAFSTLQHVQILRLQDREDGLLLGYIRGNHDPSQLINLKWAPACSHSTKTLGTALLASSSPCTRFSSPMLSPQSAQILAINTPRSWSFLAERLTSLELHFDDGVDLDQKMLELSNFFCIIFTAAVNMQTIHLGFPSHRPVDISLENIFHHVKWEKLVAFGIQGWKLEAKDIIALAGRHRERLRGLRLRDVFLKENSMWKEVLRFLHDEMPQLDWVSLRRIGYAKTFDEQWAAAGVEVPDDIPGGISDSDEEPNDQSSDDSLSDNDVASTDHDRYSNTDVSEDQDATTDDDADDDGEQGPSAHEISFPQMSNERQNPKPWCNCNSRGVYPVDAEDLGDDGIFVGNMQRKNWEVWITGRCAQHSSKSRA